MNAETLSEVQMSNVCERETPACTYSYYSLLVQKFVYDALSVNNVSDLLHYCL